MIVSQYRPYATEFIAQLSRPTISEERKKARNEKARARYQAKYRHDPKVKERKSQLNAVWRAKNPDYFKKRRDLDSLPR